MPTSLAAMLALINDNTSGDISAADHRATIEGLYEWTGWNLDIGKPGAADTPDDDFTAGTLDAKWTVVAGTAQAVGLLDAGPVSRYDLTTRPGYLLTQVGNDGSEEVALRQDYTLPDGASIIASVFPAASPPNLGSDERIIGIAVNSSDTDFDAGTFLRFQWAADGAGSHLTSWNGTTAHVLSSGSDWYGGHLLRIARSGTTYYPLASMNRGRSWLRLGPGYALGSAMSNVWLFDANRAGGDPPAVAAWDWVRQGTNAVDPW
jgi:hypothetical protein